MKCSIILTGKNDNYGGYFDERLILTTKYNIKKLTKLGAEVEVIFIEWNPLEDKPLLSEKLSKVFDDIKCYVVDNETHSKFCGEFEYMTFLEFFAKNIGIRKATGDILICSNADVFYDDNVVEFISKGLFKDNCIYRAERRDIRFHKLKSLTSKSLENAVFNENPVGKSPYIDGSGDFTMATKKTFENLTGYDESVRFVKIHKDSRILWSAFDLETINDTAGIFSSSDFNFELIGNIYHIDHEGSAVGTSGDLRNYREANGPYVWLYFKDLPYKNNEFWGMHGNSVEEKISNKIKKISFIENFEMKNYNFRDAEFMFENLNDEEKLAYMKLERTYITIQQSRG